MTAASRISYQSRLRRAASFSEGKLFGVFFDKSQVSFGNFVIEGNSCKPQGTVLVTFSSSYQVWIELLIYPIAFKRG